MKIREAEDALFNEWRPSRQGFVSDGAADDEAFVSSSKRILFILKEVNDLDGGGWDLRQYMREGGRSYTWDNITRWVDGIRMLPRDMQWDEVKQVDHNQRVRALQSIAAINIKKSPGTHTSDRRQLAFIAAQDREFLNRQVLIYDADLIICCGVPPAFHTIVSFGSPPKWRWTSRGIEYHEFRPGKFVISYHHPEARVADCILYYGLLDAVREIATSMQGAADGPGHINEYQGWVR